MDIDTLTKFEATLKDGGFNLTKTRRLVFSLLYKQEPQSINELNHKINGKLDRVTLYRTLQLFEKLAIVQRVYSGWKYKIELTDSFSYHHHHMSCIRCGQVTSFRESEEIEQLIDKLGKSEHFQVTTHLLEIQGLCQACHAKI
jgi:Fur family ferric uptake transcriptional regulator